MKPEHQPPKLKTTIFSTCGLFCHCAQNTLSPTTPQPPSLPLAPSVPPSPPTSLPPPSPSINPSAPRHKPESSSSSSSSSASTSQSFTQWRFPVPHSPLLHSPIPRSAPPSNPSFLPTTSNYQELFHLAEIQLASGSENETRAALYLLERSIVPNPPSHPICSIGLMRALVQSLRDPGSLKSATKILLALCLAEANRRVAVEAGVVGAIVETAPEMDGSSAERALAALELACTVPEGVAELRAHALAVPVMVMMMGRMSGRGKESAISALGMIYTRGEEVGLHAPSDEVARAVELALQQGDCSERGKRKGGRLLLTLRDYNSAEERTDLVHVGDG